MFTGLVECVGQIQAASGVSPRRLQIRSSIPTGETGIGDSVAIDGCCLTVVAKTDDTLTFEAATETLAVTTLGRLQVGDPVNLERALRLGDRLGGHLVLGHVDGIGTVCERQQRDSALYLGVEVPADIARLVAKRGSVTLQGVSLTVTDVQDQRFWVGLIPHTLEATNLDQLQVGNAVNVEVDVMARYLERLVSFQNGPDRAGDSLTEQYLKDKGFA